MNTPLIAGIGFGCFGLYMISQTLKRHKQALASEGWSQTNGKMLDTILWGKRNIGGEMKDVQHLRVKYQYSVNGVEYIGNDSSFYTLMYPDTVKFVEAHPENSEVTVFYNPDNPKQSVIIKGVNKEKPFSGLVLAGFAMIIGFAVAIAAGFNLLGN